MDIQSASNRQLTLLRKLNRKKYRYKEGLFLLEGARAVQQVLENESVLVKVLFFDEDQMYWTDPGWKKWRGDIESKSLKSDEFAEVTDTDTPQGVLALCHMPDETSVDEFVQKKGIIVAFDHIQDPGNVGTMIRSAAWFGVQGILAGKGTVDLFHPKVVRSTAGATGSVPYRNVELTEVLANFEDQGWNTVLLDGSKKAEDIRSFSPRDKTILIVGNEANGIDQKLFTKNRSRVAICRDSTSKSVESLNASIALSIGLFALST